MFFPQMGIILVQAIILGIEKDDIDTHLGRNCCQLTSYFEQHSHSATAVVRSGKRLAMVGFVGVAVGPGTGVPMCTEHYAVAILGVKLRHDVTRLEAVSVIGSQVHILGDDRCSVALQLGDEVVATLTMCRGGWHARAKVHLRFYEALGTVGIEYGHNNGRLYNSLSFLRLLGIYNLLLAR